MCSISRLYPSVSSRNCLKFSITEYGVKRCLTGSLVWRVLIWKTLLLFISRDTVDGVLGFRRVWMDVTELGGPQTSVLTPVVDRRKGTGWVTTERLRPAFVPGQGGGREVHTEGGRLVDPVGRHDPGVPRTRVNRQETTVLILPTDVGDGTNDALPSTVQVPGVQVLPPPVRVRITGFILVVDETTNLGGSIFLSTHTEGWESRFLQAGGSDRCCDDRS